MNAQEVVPEMNAVLSIDTTKGNRILNHKGFAISPTVKQGYILRVSDDLIRIMEMTTGRLAVTFPITTQDITPYGNGVYHLNSILQPSIATAAPVVGVALCTESVVPGCGTGASHETDIALAVKFAVEVAKEFTRGTCQLLRRGGIRPAHQALRLAGAFAAPGGGGGMTMRSRKLGTITIGQAPRPDITPILDAAIGAEVPRLHVGLLDGLDAGGYRRALRPRRRPARTDHPAARRLRRHHRPGRGAGSGQGQTRRAGGGGLHHDPAAVHRPVRPL